MFEGVIKFFSLDIIIIIIIIIIIQYISTKISKGLLTKV